MDPSSFSNKDHEIKHCDLDWSIDFNSKKITGTCLYSIKVNNEQAKQLVLDSKALDILEITSNGQVLKYNLANTSKIPGFGEKLTIELSESDLNKQELKLLIKYSTTKDCSALQWLTPDQTVGKVHPYLFSQCQAIHARSILPCQDTPSVKITYSAKVTVPQGLRALMSAVPTGNEGNVFTFKQNIAIPSYLIAIAVGDIVGIKVGPRTTVWSEPAVVKAAAWEFEDTESFIKAGEDLLTPYVWGVYDLLLLPASFPYGGMENPCLTFVTPTLLAGDRTLVDVVAHEIAHSWCGNLVGCSSWENFWLNEGWTVFVERKIISKGKGEKVRHFNSIIGLTHLKESVDHMNQIHHPEYTCLCPKLLDTDPDDVFSSVPYEKGFNLLFYLEQLLGGPSAFEPYMKAHIIKFSHKAITTEDFKSFLYEFFASKKDLLDTVDWNAWFNTPGMPPVDNKFDRSLLVACEDLSKTWINSPSSSISAAAFEKMDTNQRVMFFDLLLESKDKKIDLKAFRKMQEIYKLDQIQNAEVKFKYQMLGLSLQDTALFDNVIKFLTSAGRMKFVRPLYRSLNACGEEGKALAVHTFKKNRQFYHPICANMVAKDLGV